MVLAIAMTKVVFGIKESNLAVIAAFGFEFVLEEVLMGLEMSFFCGLIWTVNVTGLAIECLFLCFAVLVKRRSTLICLHLANFSLEILILVGVSNLSIKAC